MTKRFTNTTVFGAVESFSNNSFANHSHSLETLGQGQKEFYVWPIRWQAVSCIAVWEITYFRVCSVAVAVNARMSTFLGSKFLIPPGSANVFQNLSSLER